MIQYIIIRYNTIQYNTIQYNTIQYNTIQLIHIFKIARTLVAVYPPNPMNGVNAIALDVNTICPPLRLHIDGVTIISYIRNNNTCDYICVICPRYDPIDVIDVMLHQY